MVTGVNEPEDRREPDGSARPAATAIRLRDVVKTYDAVTAVDGIDLDVDAGVCLGLLGPNGAGKSNPTPAGAIHPIVTSNP